MSWLWSTNGLKLDLPFSTLRKFCILLHCYASQTEASKRNLAKLCQTVDRKSRQQSELEKSGSSVPKMGAKTTFTFVEFSTTSTLNDKINIFWMKQQINSWLCAFENKWSALWSKNSWTLVLTNTRTQLTYTENQRPWANCWWRPHDPSFGRSWDSVWRTDTQTDRQIFHG